MSERTDGASRTGRACEAGPRVYFSLRSPYSWLAWHDLTTRHAELARAIEWRPFWEPDALGDRLLAAAGGRLVYTPMSPEKHRYILQDVRRLAAARGLRPAWPVDRDPVWEVPHLAYLAAREQGAGPAFVAEIHRARWARGEDICDRAVIARIGRDLGVDVGHPDDPALRALGTAALLDVYRDDVFGVPYFVHRRERFWGVDRLPDFVAAVSGRPAAADLTGGAVAGPVPPAGGRTSDGGHAGGCG